MTTTMRLSGEERRAAIIGAVRKVFAEKGFHGTTTRELAQAAGVSEALLFKHFPNKEALFTAIQLSCCNEHDLGVFERLTSLKPSASTLVKLVQFLVSRIIGGVPGHEEKASQHRLVLRSLAEDGDFARILLGRLSTAWLPKVEACLTAAVADGDATAGPVPGKLNGLFAYHLAAIITFHLLPATPAIDYGETRDQLADHATWFILRGMGLKEEVIRRHVCTTQFA